MSAMRKPFFVVSLLLMLLVVIIECGASLFVGAESTGSFKDLQQPGLGIPYLALLDGLLLFGVGLIGLGLILPDRLQGRIQGIATLLVSFVMLILSIVMIYVALVLLMLMVSLLLAVPFGTAVYFAKFADFDTGPAAATLAVIMALKIGFAVFLLLAHERFLEMKGLVFLILTSLLASVIVSFLHGFPPVFVVSITDDIAAIIIAVLAVIWSLLLLIGSIPAVIKALRVDRAF